MPLFKQHAMDICDGRWSEQVGLDKPIQAEPTLQLVGRLPA